MNVSFSIPPFRFCGQAFLFAWRMSLFFSPLAVTFSLDPYQELAAGRFGYLLLYGLALVLVYRLGRRGRSLSERAMIGWGVGCATAGTLLAILGASFALVPAIAAAVAFAIAGAGDAFLTLAFAMMYRSLSVRLSMRAVPMAMVIAALIYGLAVNNAVPVSLPVVVLLPVACGAVLFHDLGRRSAEPILPPEGIPQVEEPDRSRFTKGRIAAYTSVLWLTFGLMWPLAVARLFGEGGLFLAFSLSVAALVAIASLTLAVLTYVLRMPAVKTFWIFVPLMFAGITVVAVMDSNIQVLAFAMVFAAHNVAEVQLTTHFSAICRRRGYSSRMLFGCGFAILSFAEALGLLVGTAVVPLHFTALTMVLLVCANVIVIAVIFSIMRVNTTFQRAELEMALAKQAARATADTLSQAGPESVDDDASASPTARTAAEWVERFGLSQRESEIAELLLSGRNVPAIAELLCISQSTVQTHVKHIYEKTGVHTRQELIALGHATLQ